MLNTWKLIDHTLLEIRAYDGKTKCKLISVVKNISSVYTLDLFTQELVGFEPMEK